MKRNVICQASSKLLMCVALALSMVTSTSLAETTTAPTNTDTRSTTNTNNTNKSPTFTLPSGATGGGGGGSAAEAGNNAAMQQILGAGVNAAAAGALYASCPSCSQGCTINCVMAAQALLQATNLMGSSKGAKNAANGMSTLTLPNTEYPNGDNGNYNGNPNGVFNGDPTGNNGDGTNKGNTAGIITTNNPDAIQKQIDNLRSKLASNGVRLSSDGRSMTLPDGRQVATSALGSDSGMAAAGFSSDQIAAGKAAAKSIGDKLASQIKAVQMAADGGGGGGGGAGRAPAAGADGGGAGMNFKMPWDKQKEARKKANVSGMSKKLGNDNIGVAGDDIFEMVTRRYKARDAKEEFLKH